MCLKPNLKSGERGAILILSLLVLSSILIVGISLGLLVLNRLRQAKNSDFSIIAYYAADSAVEDALYGLRKLNKTTVELNALNSGSFENNALWERSIATTPVYRALIRKNLPVMINLYDTDVDCGTVKRVKYIWSDLTPATTPHPDLEVTYYAWQTGAGGISVLPDYTNQDIFNDILYQVNGQVDGPWQATSTPLTLLNTCYSIRVKALQDDAELTLRTCSDQDCNNIIGIPSYLTINATGKFYNSKQKIQTMVLKDPPLSSLFEYVLFSEEPINK